MSLACSCHLKEQHFQVCSSCCVCHLWSEVWLSGAQLGWLPILNVLWWEERKLSDQGAQPSSFLNLCLSFTIFLCCGKKKKKRQLPGTKLRIQKCLSTIIVLWQRPCMFSREGAKWGALVLSCTWTGFLWTWIPSPTVSQLIRWGFDRSTLYDSVMLLTASQRKISATRCSPNGRVGKNMLHRISLTLAQSLRRLIDSQCSTPTDINPLASANLSCRGCFVQPKVQFFHEISSISFASKHSTLHVNWVQSQFPLWWNEKINSEFQYFVFIHHGASYHCNDTVPHANDKKSCSRSLL